MAIAIASIAIVLLAYSLASFVILNAETRRRRVFSSFEFFGDLERE